MAYPGKKQEAPAKQANEVRVLLVQAEEAEAQTTKRLLSQSAALSIQVTRVEWLSAALKHLSEQPYDAVLLDFAIVDTHGEETFNLVQSAVARVPIVLLAKPESEASALQALEHGAQDYVLKDALTSDGLETAIRKAILRKKAEKNLSYLAQQDHLTDVANRALFRDRIVQALARRKRKPQSIAVLRLGLDRFTQINEEYGQEGGDALLKTAASRLRSALREVDTVARLWGDEFTILLDGMAQDADAKLVAQRLLNAVAEPYAVGAGQASLTASIGVTIVGGEKISVDELLQQAETAMHKAKGQGGNVYCFYSAADG